MLRRLIAHIDALGDRVHPIVVLNSRGIVKPLVVFSPFFVFHIALGLCVGLGGEWVHAPGTISAARIVLAILFFFLFLAPFCPFDRYQVWQRLDPLLLLIPCSDRSIWAAFYLIGLLEALRLWCCVMFMVSYCYALQWVTLEWVFFPLFCLLAGCFFATLGLSLTVAARTGWQRGFLIPIWMLLFFSVLIGAFLRIMFPAQCWAFLFQVFPESLFEPICWVPVLVLAVPTYLGTAWKLFNFNLVRRRSFIIKYGVSILAYVTLTAFLVGLWFALRWVFGMV